MKVSMIRAALVGACAALMFGAVPVFAQNIAVVNGKPISKAKYDEIIANVTKGDKTKDTADLDAKVKDHLISMEILAQEADKRKLSQDPRVQEQMDEDRQQILIQALVDDYIKANPPTEAETRAKYAEIAAKTTGKEYHLHHILVEKESDAKGLIAKLKTGANFDDLAIKMSKDTLSAPNGGDLGWMSLENTVPEFRDAVLKMQKGATSPTPVKSQYGYHVIRLDDVRDRTIDPYDALKDRVAQYLMQDRDWRNSRANALLADLKKTAKVE